MLIVSALGIGIWSIQKWRFPESAFVEYEIVDIIMEYGSGELIVKK